MLLTLDESNNYSPLTMRSLSRMEFLWTVVYRVAGCGWAILIAACCLTSLQADEARAGAQRVVLLKNDRCLTGVVRHLGETVVIEIDSDARVSKPASEVLTIADDMQGIYQYKVSRYARLGPGEHIRLARWCLSVGLHAEAANHFLAVNKEAGDHPVVKQLGIELREHLLADADFRQYLGLTPLTTLAAESTPVQLVSSTSGQADVRPVIPAVVASFTEHVQPILLNRCSQSGCHGLSATNSLRLLQPLGSARARISEQNCRSVLPFVEVDDSNMSQLQRYAVTAHGTQKIPALSAQEARLIDVLQSWTTFARNPVMAAVNTTPAGSPGAVARAVYHGQVSPQAAGSAVTPAAVKPHGVPPRTGPVAGPSESELDALDDEVRRALGEPPRIPKGTAPDLERNVPNRPPASPEKAASMFTPAKDPFDPAEFNRRVGAKTGP